MKKKNIHIALLALVLAGGLGQSCNKETINPQNTKQAGIKPKPLVRQAPMRVLAEDPLTVIAAYEDPYQQRLHYARYAAGNAFRHLVTQEMVEFIYDGCAASGWESMLLSEVFAEFPELESDMNDYLQNNPIPGMPFTFNSIADIEAVFAEDDGEQEFLEVNVPNLATSDKAEAPIITCGIEVEDEPEFMDQYMGWDLTSSTQVVIKMTEDELYAQLSPAINLGKRKLSDHSSQKPTGINSGPFSNNNPWGMNNFILLEKFRIYKRFDNTKHSEVCYNASGFDVTSTLQFSWNTNFPVILGAEFVKVADVHKNDMQKWITVNHVFSRFMPIALTPNYSRQGVLWNMYERDWLEGLKAVGSAKINNVSVTITGRMTGSDETYFYHKNNCHHGAYWFLEFNRSNDIWNAGNAGFFGTGNYEQEVVFKRI